VAQCRRRATQQRMTELERKLARRHDPGRYRLPQRRQEGSGGFGEHLGRVS
jgi:hypothetical protein